jgi:hypothetical protein
LAVQIAKAGRRRGGGVIAMTCISRNPLVYRFSRREIARCKCIDCGVNVIKVGDYCMLHPDLWERKLHLKWDDNMCVACIEAHVGRKLSLRDCINFPSVEGFPMSDVLADRLFGHLVILKSGEAVARNSPRGKAELRKRAA